jgi:dihydrolipoamide dehydrogenase
VSASELTCDVAVLGAGPGGYSAAFRAADLGKRVVLVERYPVLGGVCLHVGCIPSKTLLHMAEIVTAARELSEAGVEFGEPRFDLSRIRQRKDAVVERLSKGLTGLARQRRVDVVTGTGRFSGEHSLEIETSQGVQSLRFEHAIIAAGSQNLPLPGLPDDARILDSTSALALESVPGRLLVVGGGVIGLELATVFDALGSEITVVELSGSLLPGVDPDLVRPLARRIAKRYANVFLDAKVSRVEAETAGLRVFFEGSGTPQSDLFDAVLVAVGRRPNGLFVGAERAGVSVDASGTIPADREQRTNVAHIFAIGDVAGGPLLAHKAIHEGRVAAAVIAGLPAAFDAVVPAVAYTDPEVAWTGLTESAAREAGIEIEKAVIPWSASGRAVGMGRSEGLTKLVLEPGSRRILGAGLVGPHAGELLGEATLAIEMGTDAEDLALTIHAHPTLSETLGLAAELAEGTATDLPTTKGTSQLPDNKRDRSAGASD